MQRVFFLSYLFDTNLIILLPVMGEKPQFPAPIFDSRRRGRNEAVLLGCQGSDVEGTSARRACERMDSSLIDGGNRTDTIERV
jgi:hypothetical protein